MVFALELAERRVWDFSLLLFLFYKFNFIHFYNYLYTLISTLKISRFSNIHDCPATLLDNIMKCTRFNRIIFAKKYPKIMGPRKINKPIFNLPFPQRQKLKSRKHKRLHQRHNGTLLEDLETPNQLNVAVLAILKHPERPPRPGVSPRNTEAPFAWKPIGCRYSARKTEKTTGGERAKKQPVVEPPSKDRDLTYTVRETTLADFLIRFTKQFSYNLANFARIRKNNNKEGQRWIE